MSATCVKPLATSPPGVNTTLTRAPQPDRHRRALSLDFVRAQALCLLTRLTYFGDGADGAARRRGLAAQDEEETSTDESVMRSG